MGNQEKIDQSKKQLAYINMVIRETSQNNDSYWILVRGRRDIRANLFILHGHAKHTETGHVLRIASMPDNLNILFIGHTVPQPVGWYEPATEQQYNYYLTMQSKQK
jgi:hypothetical protein